MIKAMIKHLIITSAVIPLLFLTAACETILNEYGFEPFDENGLLRSSFIDTMCHIEEPTNICFYVESSGSMNGLFRKGQPTRFKYDVSAVLVEHEISKRTGGVCVFNNYGDDVSQYEIKSFRQMMNNGDFISQHATIVPNMLDKMLMDIDSGKCDMAVLISDMKYAPVGVSAPKVAMDQYKLDITSKFMDRQNLAVSIVTLESDYIGANGKTLSSKFPYYLTIIGPQEKVAWMRDKIENALGKGSGYQGTINYNISFGCPVYTVLPESSIGMLRNNFEYLEQRRISASCTSFDSSVIPGEIVVAINYRHLPSEILKSLSDSDFTIKSYWGDLKCTLENVSLQQNASNNNDRELIDHTDPNVFLKIRLDGLKHYNSDMLKITLNDSESFRSYDQWVKKYFGATKEGDLERTLSIDAFFDGLKDAYPDNNLQTTPIYIFITTKDFN